MIRSKFGTAAAAFAVLGMASAGPALAAGATRSAAALPLIAASVGSIPYTKGAENAWHCAQVSDQVLKLNKKYVQVDEAGRVVVDPKGVPFDCNAPSGAYQAAAGRGFPFAIVLGGLGVAGLLAALAGGGGGGGNDSPG